MAAYASTVTSTMKRAVKIDQVLGIGLFVGEVNITNYNPTLAEITGISKKFKSVLAVVCACSDLGYLFEWVDASKSLKVFAPSQIKVRTGSTAVADATTGALLEDSAAAEGTFRAMGTAINTDLDLGKKPGVEESVDIDVGSAHFIAYGLI